MTSIASKIKAEEYFAWYANSYHPREYAPEIRLLDTWWEGDYFYILFFSSDSQHTLMGNIKYFSGDVKGLGQEYYDLFETPAIWGEDSYGIKWSGVKRLPHTYTDIVTQYLERPTPVSFLPGVGLWVTEQQKMSPSDRPLLR